VILGSVFEEDESIQIKKVNEDEDEDLFKCRTARLGGRVSQLQWHGRKEGRKGLRGGERGEV
jgi:hypothetical protein